jgi:hypothetical protein
MQNSVHQSIENPHAVYEVLFYGSKVEVWCAIHVWRIDNMACVFSQSNKLQMLFETDSVTPVQ